MNLRLLILTIMASAIGITPIATALANSMCPSANVVSEMIDHNWSMPYVCYDNQTGKKMKCYQSIFTTNIHNRKVIGLVWTSVPENGSFTNRNLQLKDPKQDKFFTDILCLYEIGNPSIFGNYGMGTEARFLTLQIPGQ